jgi:hypothetical protein
VILEFEDIGPIFGTALQHLIALAWNRQAGHCPLVKRVFLLQLSDLCGSSATYDGWIAFAGAVLVPFRQRERFSADFVVPEEGMSADLVQLINDPAEIAAFVAEHFNGRRKSESAAAHRLQDGARTSKGHHRKRRSAPVKKKCSVV